MQFIPLNLNASWQDKIGIPQRKRLRHDTNQIFSLPAADFPPPVFPFSRGAGDKERGIKGAAEQPRSYLVHSRRHTSSISFRIRAESTSRRLAP